MTNFAAKSMIAKVGAQVLLSQNKTLLQQKNAMQLLDMAVCQRNKDFNIFVLENIMPQLLQLVVEIETPRCSNDLVLRTLLLDSIQKWSSLSSNFAECYKNLIDIGT